MRNRESYLSTYQDDFRNPYSRSIIKKPPKPPEWTRNNEETLYKRDCYDSSNVTYYQPKPIDFECGEADNQFGEHLEYNDKKQGLVTALRECGCQLNDNIMNSMNNSSTYNTKKEYPVIQCKALKFNDNCDCDSDDLAVQNSERYRDPFPFRVYAVNSAPNYRSPIEEVCSGPSFFNKRSTLGISEYMDTISKAGRSTMLAIQQFREPTPSSRRRLEGQCIQTC
ncbi:uncharacterized protein LOC111059899 [Nilaparvata lugens]|uniref:uncharacterized protein LOC111059899 n=1 Tax=Nilaparvata lugens TaxID=108931 RepID=UPI00193C96F4|nr:uncharacterized protein LOC111059899 [Nilaparvata lugens]